METNILLQQYGGMKYYMNFDKIANSYYPHFIAEYEGHSMKFALDLSIMEGMLNDKEKVFEAMNWAMKNNELLENMWGELIKKRIDHLNIRRAV